MNRLEAIILDLEELHEEVAYYESLLTEEILYLLEEDVAMTDLVYFCNNGVYPV